MGRRFRFKKLPAYAGVTINSRSADTPDPREMYEYAVAYRSAYTRTLPMSKKVSTDGALPVREWKQLHAIPQALVVNLALSCEILLKAVILCSKGKIIYGHSLKHLFNSLDSRHKDYITAHLTAKGLNKGAWNKVIKESDKIFETARYGYEGKGYKVDFMTLQLINEALDDIYHKQLPEWPAVNDTIRSSSADKDIQIKKLLDEVFNPPELDDFIKAFTKEMKR